MCNLQARARARGEPRRRRGSQMTPGDPRRRKLPGAGQHESRQEHPRPAATPNNPVALINQDNTRQTGTAQESRAGL